MPNCIWFSIWSKNRDTILSANTHQNKQIKYIYDASMLCIFWHFILICGPILLMILYKIDISLVFVSCPHTWFPYLIYDGELPSIKMLFMSRLIVRWIFFRENNQLLTFSAYANSFDILSKGREPSGASPVHCAKPDSHLASEMLQFLVEFFTLPGPETPVDVIFCSFWEIAQPGNCNGCTKPAEWVSWQLVGRLSI